MELFGLNGHHMHMVGYLFNQLVGGPVYRWRTNHNGIIEVVFCSGYSTPVMCKNNIYSL